MRLRLALAASLSLSPLVPLTARLTKLQVMEHRSLESRASSEFNRSSQEATPRADILDRNGNILAQSVPVWACFADKRMIYDAPGFAAKLSSFLKLPAADILRKLRASRRFAWLKTNLSYEEQAALSAAKIDGLGIAPSRERFYPNGDLARGVLGQVSSERGASGIELALDSRLTGKARRFKVIRDGSGQTIYKSAEKTEPAPAPIRLTIDRSIQYFAEEALIEAAAQFKMKSGLIAVQNPNNGEILAMATYPSDPLHNPVVQDTYEPGSTFKIVAAAAAIEERALKLADIFFCENGSYEISPGVVIHDHEPAGNLTLSGILERSSNIGIAKVVERLGAAVFYRYLRAFGFTSKTGIQLPGETSGEARALSQMSKVSLASASYGYGVGVSPLQILSAYSAVANGGTLWEPSLIEDGRAPARVRQVASAGTMAILSGFLESVVEGGTGVSARIPGYRVAGKTGTARRLDPITKKYSQTDYNASFVGFLPAGSPQWTILIVITSPQNQYYGAQVAAPIFAKLGRRMLALKGVPRDGR